MSSHARSWSARSWRKVSQASGLNQWSAFTHCAAHNTSGSRRFRCDNSCSSTPRSFSALQLSKPRGSSRHVRHTPQTIGTASAEPIKTRGIRLKPNSRLTSSTDWQSPCVRVRPSRCKRPALQSRRNRSKLVTVSQIQGKLAIPAAKTDPESSAVAPAVRPSTAACGSTRQAGSRDMASGSSPNATTVVTQTA